jgi:Type I phosphodiesterase / nucleotide pyrophosphatase
MPTFDRVILLIIDGLRPDALTPDVMPRLVDLASRGWSANHAVTVRPSVTVAALTSLGTGVAPAEHGFLDPGLASLVRWRGLRLLPLELRRADIPTAVGTEAMPGSQRLLAKSLLGIAGVQALYADAASPAEVAYHLSRWLERSPRGLAVAYVNRTDRAGHRDGWMSERYLAEAAAADHAVAEFDRRLDAKTLLIVTADHGGGGVDSREHDAPHPDNDRIPVVLAGRGIRAGTHGAEPVSLLDVPVTVLHALRVPRPAAYRGRVLEEAFEKELAGRVLLEA